MFKVYSKPQCTFCEQAKALLKQHECAYLEYMLDMGQPKEEGKNYVSRDEILEVFPGARTMPQILLDFDGHQTKIGGYQELKQFFSNKD